MEIDQRCCKCDMDSAIFKYKEGADFTKYKDIAPLSAIKYPEEIILTCRRCGYVWSSPCFDAKEQT